jgi:hypothetical protein
MAKRSDLTVEALVELGAAKLAQMIHDEAERSSSFRKLVKTALAGSRGPDAVAKLIDRRLLALEKARGFVGWEKERSFRDDLRTTLATITGELGQSSHAMAVDRLLRFIATHETVFERVDDSSGRIQDVYHEAIAALGELAARLSPEEAGFLPEKIMASLGQSAHGYLDDVTEVVVAHIPALGLEAWDRDIRSRQGDATATNDPYDYRISQFTDLRQIIARALGDLDGLIAIENEKNPNRQDAIGIAELLFEANRLDEALDWVRNKAPPALRYMSADDLAHGIGPQDPLALRQVRLEAAILTAKGEAERAQELRWALFERSLSPEILRDHVGALADFEEFAVLDRAFAHAMASPHRYNTLSLFMEWPKYDLAAELVIANAKHWDGGQYHILPPIAGVLEHEFPLAATVIYRVLIDDILDRARSKAYGHAARYVRGRNKNRPKSYAKENGARTRVRYWPYCI